MEKAGSSPASTARYGRKKLTLRVFVLFVLLLPFHENLRVLLDLLSHSRMGAQELPQLRMTIQIILVIHPACPPLPPFPSLPPSLHPPPPTPHLPAPHIPPRP